MKYLIPVCILAASFLLDAPRVGADPIPTDPDPAVWGSLDPTSFVDGSAYDNDYSNAPSPYSSTGNGKGHWQGLGTVNGNNDGVLWSVGGSAFGTDANLILGQEVTFRFLFWQSNNGSHAYDQIFAAFDFGQDGGWEHPEDTILYQQVSTTSDTIRDPLNRTLSRYLEFEVSFVVPETMSIGTTWLRARSHCNHVPWGDITADNWLPFQGETEDYKLNIVAPVPEPATLILFGTGLAGLAGYRSRRKAKK